MTTTKRQEVLDRVYEGFRRVRLTFPHLAGLVPRIQVVLDERVPTMGIFASGRLVVNPEFANSLSAEDLLFVLTHELYHLTLRTHDRAEGTNHEDFNTAHDFIINDLLRHELQRETIPAGGLDWPGARTMSAEQILAQMDRHPQMFTEQYWDLIFSDTEGSESGQGNRAMERDVLDAVLERKWFPDTNNKEQQKRTREVQDQASRSLSLKALLESMRGRGSKGGERQETVTALRGLYRPSWELALQRWLESSSPSDRCYSRPSRRGADRTDVVLPGRKREGWTLHLVLDTSGSMADEIPKALGAIADFCEATGVEQIHLIQCDTEVGRDEILAPAELPLWQVTGYGGSDLTPAMLRLAEDPDVQAVLVLTDGDISYPDKSVPYRVLWVLPPWKNASDFTPPYGKVIALTNA